MLGGSSPGKAGGVGDVEYFDVDAQEWSPAFTLPSGID